MLLPGESHGQRSLVGYSPGGRRESDWPEQLTHTHTELWAEFPVLYPWCPLVAYFIHSVSSDGAYQMVLVVKNPAANAGNWKETSVWSLGREDPLEEDMAAHSSILAWRTPWTEEPGGLQSIALQRVEHNWSNLACMHTYIVCICQCQSPSAPHFPLPTLGIIHFVLYVWDSIFFPLCQSLLYLTEYDCWWILNFICQSFHYHKWFFLSSRAKKSRRMLAWLWSYSYPGSTVTSYIMTLPIDAHLLIPRTCLTGILQLRLN